MRSGILAAGAQDAVDWLLSRDARARSLRGYMLGRERIEDVAVDFDLDVKDVLAARHLAAQEHEKAVRVFRAAYGRDRETRF